MVPPVGVRTIAGYVGNEPGNAQGHAEAHLRSAVAKRCGSAGEQIAIKLSTAVEACNTTNNTKINLTWHGDEKQFVLMNSDVVDITVIQSLLKGIPTDRSWVAILLDKYDPREDYVIKLEAIDRYGPVTFGL